MLRPGGALSLMFYNANGLLMHNMVAGNFDYVQLGHAEKEKRTLSPDYPRDPQQVYGWLEEIGWQIVGKPACGCFMIICVKNANSMTVLRRCWSWKRATVVRSRISAWAAIFMSPRLSRRCKDKL
jgi:S-adenosylmethionine-dependent methyltransferase